MSGTMQRFAAPDGRRLAYCDSGEAVGEGPAALCLAGLTRNHRDFADLAAHLAPRHRVLRLDSRGRGASEHAEDPLAEYTAATEAQDALALLDHLGLSGVALIGTSRGGILGMAMAAMRPGAIAGLALNDIGPEVATGGLQRILTYLGVPPEAGSFAELARTLRDASAAQFPGVSLAQWEKHARCGYDARDGRPILSYDPALREATIAAMAEAGGADLDLWPMFAAVTAMPLLAIRGENSDVLSAGTLQRMAEAHPGMTQVTLRDRGHAPFLDEPEALAAIDDFLARIPPPRKDKDPAA